MSIIKVLNQFYIFFIILLGNFCFAQSSELKGWSSLEYGFDINESCEGKKAADLFFKLSVKNYNEIMLIVSEFERNRNRSI